MEIKLNTSSGQPLYEQIVSQIRLMILQGTLKEGDKLPSIRALACDLQVSIITTRRAYEELELQGVLAVSSGRGTFVREGGVEDSKTTQMQELVALLEQSAAKAVVLGLGTPQFAKLAGDVFSQTHI